MRPSPGDLKLAAAIAEYGKLHQNRPNKLIHCICVTAIVFSIIGLLVAINFGITLIALAAAILYYNQFGQRTAIQMGAVLILMLVIWVSVMPSHHLVLIALGIFILAGTGQAVGQIYQGSKPFFVENLQYLLIGPLYVLAELKGKLARNPRLDPL
jgi:uncharacterized membrane protein YGL010W